MVEQLTFRVPYVYPMIEGGDAEVICRFYNWLRTPEGTEAFELYCEKAFEAVYSGAGRIGSKCLWESMRFDIRVKRARGSKFKLNNDFTPYAARLAEKMHPRLRGCFEKRTTKSE